tara:strand:- start:2893 stop:4095 length:1203 start_codon:yes stop_codon:yes gene_type:complete
MGTSLCRVDSDGTVTALGDVGGTDDNLVTMDYSFDLLAIASGGNLFYWDGTSVNQVTDPDLGDVLDVVWVDGYFMITDGTFLVVTELLDPYAVNPLKYGSSEIDPDPIVAVVKLRNEIYALNRHTIEVFTNTGGDLFPFQRIQGAQIQKGVIGTHGCCVFVETVAFLGSGRNESPGIFLGVNSGASKISTQDIDETLTKYTEAQLATVKLEARNDRNHKHLYIHLPDKTLVFDSTASQAVGSAVWFVLSSEVVGFGRYKARDIVWCYDKWLIGDPESSAVGFFNNTIGSHYGNNVRWEFSTEIVYNEGRGAIFHELELVSLTGGVAFGTDPVISTSYSVDGATWGQSKSIHVGARGNRTKRLVWFQQGNMINWRIQRFQGESDAHISFARLEAQLEPLAY